MNSSRLLLAAAWLASVIAAWFLGSSSEQPAPAKSDAVSPDSSALANAAPTTPPPTLAPGSSSEASESRSDIPAIIARARGAISGMGGGMMNMRAMLRAIAPIAELDDSQLQAALAEVEKTVTEPQQKMMFYSLLLGQWAEKDGRAAMEYAKTKVEDGSMFGMGVTASVLGAWAHSDPEAVWTWFQEQRKTSQPGDRSEMMAVSAVFSGIAATNLELALSRLNSLDESTRAMAISGIAMSASDASSRRRLLERSAALPAEQRDQIRRSAVGQWAMSNPADVIDWIRTLPADEQKPVRESAGQMMLMSKPALGADFMLEGAEEKDRPQLYNRVVSQWASSDPRATGEWLTKQSQGPELDSARRTYAMIVSQREPASAMNWAASVQDPKDRVQTIGQVFNTWRAKDGPAAEAALKSLGLSAEEMATIQTPAPERADEPPTFSAPTRR